jgi:hypothetical protein
MQVTNARAGKKTLQINRLRRSLIIARLGWDALENVRDSPNFGVVSGAKLSQLSQLSQNFRERARTSLGLLSKY